jgi:RNA-directed DNA polymerase
MNQRQWSRHCTLESIASVENLFLAANKARRSKSRRPDVEAWWLRRETELAALREELLSGAYQPGPYHFFEIHEPKRRMIAAAPFRDRVVHHALCHRLAPVLERRFIARSFSCQVGKGTTAARECCRQLTNRHAYVLKCDVRKFFPNIDHAILLDTLARWVVCPSALALVEQILGSYRTPDGVAAPRQSAANLLAAGKWRSAEPPLRPRGLPIGNLTSQLWGNFYLDDLDHWTTETQRHGAYLRYTDDFLLFGDDQARLWELRAGIVAQLARVRLALAEPKSRLLTTREGVPFCGFRFQPGLRPRVLGATKRRFERRRCWLARAREFRRLGVAVLAWYQFSREGNSLGLRRSYCRACLGYRSLSAKSKRPGQFVPRPKPMERENYGDEVP